MPGAVLCLFSAAVILTLCYPEHRDHCSEQNECQIRNKRLWIHYLWPFLCQVHTRPSEVIWVHWTRVTSKDRFFSWGLFQGILESLIYFGSDFLTYVRLYGLQKIVISSGPLWVFDLTPEVIGWYETFKLGAIGFLSLRAKCSSFPQSSNFIRAGPLRDPMDLYPPRHARRCKQPHTEEGGA